MFKSFVLTFHYFVSRFRRCRATTFLGCVLVSFGKFFATYVAWWMFHVLGICRRKGRWQVLEDGALLISCVRTFQHETGGGSGRPPSEDW